MGDLWQQEARVSFPVEQWHVFQGDSNDCGPYSAAITGNALCSVLALDAPTLARSLEQWNKRQPPGRIPGWATFPWGVRRALRELGLRAKWRIKATRELLLANIHADIVQIVLIGEPFRRVQKKWAGWAHYKTLVAWHPQRGWGFVDSAVPQADLSWQADEEFTRLWANMGQQVIEVAL